MLSTLDSTLYAVYDAKKAAEVAPGVGRETEMAVISNGEIWRCPGDLLKSMKDAHDEHVKEAEPKVDDVKKKYAELRKTR